jgi:predicted enzyme related to lactoylglutathione lyase
MANAFVHIELSTDNVKRAKDFYGKLFQWKFEEMPMPGGSYTMLKAGEGPGGGLMQKQSPQAPSAWLAYVEVDDVAKAVVHARELGGKIITDKTPIPDMGAFAIIADPTGAVLGLYEAKRK